MCSSRNAAPQRPVDLQLSGAKCWHGCDSKLPSVTLQEELKWRATNEKGCEDVRGEKFKLNLNLG